MSSIEEILANARALLGPEKSKKKGTKTPPAHRPQEYYYPIPNRNVIFFYYLSNSTEPYRQTMRHVYFGFPSLNSNVAGLDEDFILHYHPDTERCAAPFFCHQFGYWPTDKNAPTFTANFEMIWRKYYGK